MKKLLSLLLILPLIVPTALAAGDFLDFTDDAEVDAAVFEEVPSDALTISSPSAILIEKTTGTVIYEKNADERMEPASVTKVMTILLIVEAIESGGISLDDAVPVSAYAASMGGSQIFLEEGERMSVREMLKSIVVASANDAAVAMAEYLAGSESAFAARMNARASELGMKNTTFKNCTGLLDDTEHLTTARDIALMSRELISHDMIKEYTTIWMDTVRGGQFGLTNTNKLVRFYDGATGLKTGFTSRSMYCLSATAERGGVEYIAVILHGATSAERFEDAKTLLNYAFANCALISASPDEPLPPVRVKLGSAKTVQPVIEGCGSILADKAAASAAEKTVEMEETVTAPVSAGQKLGTLTVTSGGKVLGVFDITAGDAVERLTWAEIFAGLLRFVFGG